jgi:hypothetical protein
MLITLLVLQSVSFQAQVLAHEYSGEERIHIAGAYAGEDANHGGIYQEVDPFTSVKLLSTHNGVVDAPVDSGQGPLSYQHQHVMSNQEQQLQHVHGGEHNDPYDLMRQEHLQQIQFHQQQHHHQQQQFQHPSQAQRGHFINQRPEQHLQVDQNHHQAQLNRQHDAPNQNQHLNFQKPQVDPYLDNEHNLQQHHQQQHQLQPRSHHQQLYYLYAQHHQQLQSHIHEHIHIEMISESSFDGGKFSEFSMHNIKASYEVVPAQRDKSKCNSIDDSSVLIMPADLAESTCGARSDHVPNFEQHNNKPSRNSNVESFPLTPQHYHYESSLMTAIRHYWREISGLCLASAIFLNWLFVFVKRKFIASGFTRHIADVASGEQQVVERQSSSSMSSSAKAHLKDIFNSSAHDSAFEENASPLSLDDADITSSGESSLSSRPRSLSSSPYSPNTSSQPSSTLINSSCTSDYISRYSSDFDSIQRLGRGGFGIVFEARNKIDDCHYAVKRICLPLEKEARERVMREVRALAKLDHAGIVRYYNAWLETPPDEWLKQHDAQLGIVHTRDGLSFPSTDGIYDKNELNANTNGDICDKFGESGDNSISEFFDNKNHFKNNKRHANGYKSDYLKRNSSSPSLDIVFEGSGSIRLEAESDAENSTENSAEKSVGLKVNNGLHLEKVYLYIQMQLCRKDTLKDWLRTNCENRDKTTIFDFFYQIVDAVEYVHSQDLIHRDLKVSERLKFSQYYRSIEDLSDRIIDGFATSCSVVISICNRHSGSDFYI